MHCGPPLCVRRSDWQRAAHVSPPRGADSIVQLEGSAPRKSGGAGTHSPWMLLWRGAARSAATVPPPTAARPCSNSAGGHVTHGRPMLSPLPTRQCAHSFGHGCTAAGRQLVARLRGMNV